jgi:2-amino-4-hydroxy-6-hydroxymethyldihydropteridine diphosphokinase
MTVAYVGMGANLGEPRTQLLAAWDALGRIADTHAIARSSLYRSAPIGYADQPAFLNCVAKLETALPAHALLAQLQQIERDLGRVRSFRNAPRTIDLDLLLYGSETIDTPGLTLPHPRMHERAFVLAPLLELDAGAKIPGRGSAAELLRDCAGQLVERADP